mgnify:CR=1 FL=1
MYELIFGAFFLFSNMNGETEKRRDSDYESQPRFVDFAGCWIGKLNQEIKIRYTHYTQDTWQLDFVFFLSASEKNT